MYAMSRVCSLLSGLIIQISELPLALETKQFDRPAPSHTGNVIVATAGHFDVNDLGRDPTKANETVRDH